MWGSGCWPAIASGRGQLKAGRCFLAESSAVELSFTAGADGRTAGIGERLPAETGTPVTAELTVSGAPGTTMIIYDQVGPEQTGTVPDSGTATVKWTTYPRYTRWVRAEVRRGNAMVALTNPVFIGRR